MSFRREGGAGAQCNLSGEPSSAISLEATGRMMRGRESQDLVSATWELVVSFVLFKSAAGWVTGLPKSANFVLAAAHFRHSLGMQGKETLSRFNVPRNGTGKSPHQCSAFMPPDI